MTRLDLPPQNQSLQPCSGPLDAGLTVWSESLLGILTVHWFLCQQKSVLFLANQPYLWRFSSQRTLLLNFSLAASVLFLLTEFQNNTCLAACLPGYLSLALDSLCDNLLGHRTTLCWPSLPPDAALGYHLSSFGKPSRHIKPPSRSLPNQSLSLLMWLLFQRLLCLPPSLCLLHKDFPGLLSWRSSLSPLSFSSVFSTPL